MAETGRLGTMRGQGQGKEKGRTELDVLLLLLCLLLLVLEGGEVLEEMAELRGRLWRESGLSEIANTLWWW